MKKITLSLVSVVALSNLAFAGGDITPVEVVVEEPVADNSAFYVGLGLSGLSLRDDFTNEEFSSLTVMLQAGYQYNQYVAIEGRYTFGFNTDYDPGTTANPSSAYEGSFSSWGLYVKPMYPIGDFSLYALLGYGGVMQDDLVGVDAYESGFQWGLGAGYIFMENVSIFVDYIALYADTGFDYRAKNHDITVDTWTVGFSYEF